MNALAVTGFAVAGALAEIPLIAIAYALPASGSIRVPQHWWRGAPAPPTVVLTTALLAGTAAGIVAASLPWSLTMPAFWLFAIMAVGLSVTDTRCRRLPHAMTGSLWITTALGLIAESIANANARPLVMASTAGVGILLLAFLLALTRPGELGLGDVNLLGVIALSLGGLSLQTAVSGLFIGISLQAVVAVANKLRNRGRASPDHLPFGPALLVGWLAAIVTHAV